MTRGVATNKKLREIIISQYCRGNSMQKVANDLNIAKSTVGDIIKKYSETASIDVRGKSLGRPRTITERERRVLVKICRKNRRGTLRQIQAQWNQEANLNISRECCRLWLHKSGYSFYKAKEKPLLTTIQKKRRLNWAKSKKSWTTEMWSNVIFSDESKFDVCVGDFRKRVIRTKSEAFHKDCLKRTVKFPKGVMIWGCMSSKGVGKYEFIDGTVNAEKYQDILSRNLIPIAEEYFEKESFIFQQDGASSHTAKTTKIWFGNHNVKVLSWPSSSPDLNVIETLWHQMKKSLRNDPQRTIPALKAKITQIWNSFTPEYCKILVDSMPKRIQAVIAAKGDVTSY